MATIPPHLIFDPYAPIPAKMSVKDRGRLQELREAYTASMASNIPKKAINVPEDAAEIFAPLLAHLQVEQLAVLGQDPRNRPIEAPVIVTRGDVDGADAGPRAILRAVLIMGSTSFIVAHNHPTGEVSPSQGDINVTRRLVAAGKAVDCPLNDHIIVARGNMFYSMRRSNPDLWT